MTAPGIGCLFVWPALLWALLAWWPRSGRWGEMGAAAITLVLLVPAIDVFFQMAQPRPGNPNSQLLPAIVVPVILMVMTGDLGVVGDSAVAPAAECGTLSRIARMRAFEPEARGGPHRLVSVQQELWAPARRVVTTVLGSAGSPLRKP